MATKKTKKSEVVGEPIVTTGSHSVRTQYPDGRVDFVVDDKKLRVDVMDALAEAEALRKSFPLSEDKKPAVKAKTARKKKSD
jgi:hypothetical protein